MAKTKIVQKSNEPRLLRRPQYKSFRLHKKIKPTLPKLSNPYQLFRNTCTLIGQHWRLFITLTLVYTLLTLVLVRGFGGTIDFAEIKNNIGGFFDEGVVSGLGISVSLFGLLLGNAGVTATPSGGAYQSILLIIMSLATIWLVRKLIAGERVTVRMGFYKGLYPLGVFTPVLLAVGLQCVPLFIGSWLYGTMMGSGIAVSGLEKFVSAILSVLLVTLSLYMVTSSVFALYISTLPDMTPMRALRSARQLVLYRRWKVLFRLGALIIILPVLAAVCMMPFILFTAQIAEWVFFILTMFGTIFAITYVYMLYRELLRE